MASKQLNFDSLVVAIQNTHDVFITQAVKTVNIYLTIRNWLIAFLARHDKSYAEYCRKLAIEAHPLKDRIILLGIEESGFWKDGKRQLEFQKSEQALYDASHISYFE